MSSQNNPAMEESISREKSLSEHEKAILANQDSRLVSDFTAHKIESELKKNWDLFYKRNETKFFKDRHWTTREFIEIAGLVNNDEEKILLEVGCGVGNFIFPLVESSRYFKIYACDISPRAVDFVKSHPSFDTTRIEAFEADITCSETLKVPSVDLVSLVFVLSAIHPNKFDLAVKNIHRVMKKGATLVFRDYGRYDMAQLRFKPGKKISENLYMRQDGTRSYFFTTEELKDLFTKNGFEEITNTYIHRRTVNVKEKVDVPRIFVQAKFVKT